MKQRLIFLLAFLLSVSMYAQPMAASFENATKNMGISVDTLDKTYKSALHTDTTRAAFNGREQEFIKGYTSLLNDLGKFLKENNFNWEKSTRCFNRIYFDKTGKIDYFLFHFKEEELSLDKQAQFEKLLNSFIEKYQFPLTNTVNFAQCSPVKYSNQP